MLHLSLQDSAQPTGLSTDHVGRMGAGRPENEHSLAASGLEGRHDSRLSDVDTGQVRVSCGAESPSGRLRIALLSRPRRL